MTVDGAMLASRDFGFMLTQGTLTMILQIMLLRSSFCSTISDLFATYTIRLGSYAICSLIRAGLGFGKLGKALRMEAPINGAEKREESAGLKSVET